MPSTPSPNLRLDLQETGENINAWGERLNAALRLIEQAITGVLAKALTGNITLSVANYTTDEARNAALIFTDGGLSAIPIVTIPAVPKLYYVENRGATYSITFTAGGGTGTLAVGRKGFLICNGTDVTIFDPKADVAALVTAAEAARDLAEDWASLVGSIVASGEYSAKEYALGDLTVTGGSAKAWATDAASPNGTTNLSAKTYAGQAATSVTNAASSASSASGFASAASGSATAAAASAVLAAASAGSVNGPAIAARFDAVEGRVLTLETSLRPFAYSLAFGG